MELVLYYIIKSRGLLIAFLILMFIIGIMCFLSIRNFRQDKKTKIMLYGLLSGAQNTDIIKISIVLVKTFLVVYATIIKDETLIWICLIMMLLATLIYVILSFKKIVYEVICTVIQGFMIYFLYIVTEYMKEIENTQIVLWIRVALIIFILMFSTYLFLKEIDIITSNRVDKNFQKENEKEII